MINYYLPLFLSFIMSCLFLSLNPAPSNCEIIIEDYLPNQLVYGPCNKEQARNNLKTIRIALLEAKKNNCKLIFPKKEIHLSPTFSDYTYFKDFCRVVNSRKNSYMKKNDYYTYSFLDFSNFDNTVDGNGVQIKIDAYELYDIIVNGIVGEIDQVCLENSTLKINQKEGSELNNSISEFVTNPMLVKTNCGSKRNHSSKEVLSEDYIDHKKDELNIQDQVKRILRSHWFSIITVNECKLESKLKIKNFDIENSFSGLISDKKFIFENNDEKFLNEIVCGVYVTTCHKENDHFSNLEKEKARKLSLFENISLKGLGQGIKVQSCDNIIFSNIQASYFTDTGFNLNRSTNCWLYDSVVAGGNDGNCTMYGGNDGCGFNRCRFSDLGRSYQLTVIESSDNCFISNCVVKKDSKTKGYFGRPFDQNANHRAIIVNRSKNATIKHNKVNASETGITIRNTDIEDAFVFNDKYRNHCRGTIIEGNELMNLKDHPNRDGTAGNGPIGIYLETSNNSIIRDNTIEFSDCGSFVVFADRGKMDPFPYRGHCTSITDNTIFNSAPDIIDFSVPVNNCINKSCAYGLWGIQIENNTFENVHQIKSHINKKARSGWALSRYAFDFYHVKLFNFSFKNNRINNIIKENCNGRKTQVPENEVMFIGNGNNIDFNNNEKIIWKKENCSSEECELMTKTTPCQ